MRLTSAATVGTLLGLALILGACSGERSATAERAAVARSDATAGVPAARRACRSQLRGFLGALDALRGKLAAGLDYRSYLREVRGVRVTYEAIQAERVGLGCLLAAGASAERAFNLYIDAANSWGECLTTASCEISSVEPKLQRRWALASDLVLRAQRGLR